MTAILYEFMVYAIPTCTTIALIYLYSDMAGTKDRFGLTWGQLKDYYNAQWFILLAACLIVFIVSILLLAAPMPTF